MPSGSCNRDFARVVVVIGRSAGVGAAAKDFHQSQCQDEDALIVVVISMVLMMNGVQ